MNEPHDPSEFSELEQRLMRCRPRSPELDIESIIKLAEDNSATAPIEVVGLDRSRKFLTPQYVGSIAASWVFGAIVGATLITWLSSGGELANQNRDTIVSSELSQPKVVSSNQTEMNPNTEVNDRAEVFLPIDLDVETLQAGMSLRSRVQLVGIKDRSIDSLASRAAMKRVRTNPLIDDVSDSSVESIDSSFTPSKPMTNAELLKEMTGEEAWRIH